MNLMRYTIAGRAEIYPVLCTGCLEVLMVVSIFIITLKDIMIYILSS